MPRIPQLSAALLVAAWTAWGPARARAGQDPARERSAAAHDARRRAMVELIERLGVGDARTLAAMRAVPRHLFVPPALADSAYQDRPWSIGHEATISQPYIVAVMTAALRLRPGERVLEIGTGSGYQAAVLDALGCSVWTIEIVEALAASARARLARLGYRRVEVRHGDGWLGWPEAAPFDAIIVTAAPDSVPPALVHQLRRGGRMILPLGPAGLDQVLVMVEKDRRGRVRSRELMAVRFVPMVR